VTLALLLPLAALWPGAASAAPQPVATIEIEGVINPVTLRLVWIAIDRAQAERAQALIIQLDTPGGLERSMRAICQRLLNAEIPVVVWVGPTGARAASAGVFITMAAHVAAMAPATNIGTSSCQPRSPVPTQNMTPITESWPTIISAQPTTRTRVPSLLVTAADRAEPMASAAAKPRVTAPALTAL